MKEVYIAGRRVRPDPSLILGEGGEAVIYDISRVTASTALKLWKPPGHPDYQGADQEKLGTQEKVKKRLRELQKKIKVFPGNLPGRVIAPREIATDKAGKLVKGYTMELLGGTEPLRSLSLIGYRQKSGIDPNDVVKIFHDLHKTVGKVHTAQAVIGDFNYLNVLIRDLQAYIIDADSMQYGGFSCRTFTARFVDPLICSPAEKKLIQVAPHSEETDWYAYALMLFECLLCVHPYGGIYQASKGKPKVKQDERPLKRISVFNKDVIYPAKAIPLNFLPDDLLHHLLEIVEKDKRGEFPLKLLDGLRWTTCSACGVVHARKQCPGCAERVPPEMVVEVVKGNVSVRRLFRTSGTFLRVAYQNGRLRYLVHENGEFKRENGGVVLRGKLARGMRYRLCGDKTVIGMQGQLVTLKAGAESSPRYVVDSFRGQTPIFDTNGQHLYWVSGGRLQREHSIGTKHIGDVLSGQTWFWTGPKFGFGFYRAGEIQIAFVFNAESSGINDNVSLPSLGGQILDATCCFTDQRCWFMVAVEAGGKIVHRCFLLNSTGGLIDSFEAEENDGSWLESIRGKCAVTFKGATGSVHSLFSATQKGLVRVQEEQGQIAEAAEFPDTKGLVDSGDSLFFGKEGLYLANHKEIRIMKISK